MKFFVAIISLFLASCQTMANTPNERLIVLEYSYQAALNTFDRQITSGLIKKGDAKALKLLNESRFGLNLARDAVKYQKADTLSIITTANTAISALILYLQEKSNGATSQVTVPGISLGGRGAALCGTCSTVN